ncbi:MAG: hypothetical protein AB7I18_07745 [Candidatus Berkiella sp.]
MSKDGVNASASQADEEFQTYFLQLAHDSPISEGLCDFYSYQLFPSLPSEILTEPLDIPEELVNGAKENSKNRISAVPKKRKPKLTSSNDPSLEKLKTAQKKITDLKAKAKRDKSRLQLQTDELIKQTETIKELKRERSLLENHNCDAKLALNILVDNFKKVNKELEELRAERQNTLDTIRGLEQENGKYYYQIQTALYLFNKELEDKNLRLARAYEKINFLEQEIAVNKARQSNPPIISSLFDSRK